VADGPEAAESLVKKEPEVPAHDPIVSRSTSGLMLLGALLLTGSLVWALYDEAIGQRPWKRIQRQFVSRYSRYLQSIKGNAGKTEAEVKQDPEYLKLDDEANAALEAVKADISEIDKQVVRIQKQLDAVTDPFQNQRGRLTVINYNVEISTGRAKERYQRQADNKKKEVVEVEMPAENGSGLQVQRMDYAKLEKTYNDLRDEKATIISRTIWLV
jgi:hypothetical protein